MKKEKVTAELAKIFYKHTKVNFEENSTLCDKPFFSPELKIPVRELVLILLEVQEQFAITIPEKALINKQFSTFNGVLKLVREVKIWE